MISDILAVSIQLFQADCLQLCEHHYPTVHNRGMRESHLGKALCRRIVTTLQDADMAATVQQLSGEDELLLPIFKVSGSEYSVWVVAHRLLSANTARRSSLLEAIDEVFNQCDPHTTNHLLLIADHWFDRSKASKEIPAWWLGQLPPSSEIYKANGISLLESNESLPACLEAKYKLTNGLIQIHHPLIRHTDGKTLHRYMLLSACYLLPS